MRTVAIFGGSFNPPHLAHQMLCLSVLETAEVDGCWMVPTYRHPFAKDLADFEHRFRMCELAVEVFAGQVQVSRIEEELGQEASRTLDTLRALRSSARSLASRLEQGASREETLPTAKRMATLIRDLREEGRRMRWQEPVVGHANRAEALIAQLGPFYFEPQAAEGG